jgi:ParB family protein of integrating conjugative element (PFGI_1 class)
MNRDDDGTPARRTASTARAELKARQASAARLVTDELTGQRPDLVPPPVREDDLPFASLIRLTLDEVEPYEKNPRHKDNEHEAEIEASIEARGLEHRLVVTRRPGEKHYVLAAGGGTRYRALGRLWKKTQNRKFFEMDFELRPYVSESHLQAAHLSENLHRADMCFWDKAQGIMNLKAELEAELGHPLTPADTIAQFDAIGLSGTKSTSISLFTFASEHLPALGETAFEVTGLAVKGTLNPGYNTIKLLSSRLGIYKGDFEIQIWLPALAAFVVARQEFVTKFLLVNTGVTPPPIDWSDVITEAHAALAEHVQVSPETIPRMLDMLQIARDVSREELLALAVSPGGTAPSPDSSCADAGDDVYTPGHRPQTPRMPGVFAAVSGADPDVANTEGEAPDEETSGGNDEDRPPDWAVAEKEAQQRQKRQQEREQAQRDTQPPSASRSGLQDPSAAEVRAVQPTLGTQPGIEHQKTLLRTLASQLAGHSRTLAGQIIERPDLPMGWMIDIPNDVLGGTPLGPEPKQIFWLLARASFQLHVARRQQERIKGTRFAEFLDTIPPSNRESQARWTLLQPSDGFEFLVTWLIDPAYVHLGTLAKQILTATMELVASHPAAFTELDHALDFQDLQQDHQAERRQADLNDLQYFCDNGATQGIVRRYFPYGNIAGLRFKPGRVAPLDLGTQQFRVYKLWSALQTIPSEKDRLIALHKALREEFPGEEISLASLFQAIQAEG